MWAWDRASDVVRANPVLKPYRDEPSVPAGFGAEGPVTSDDVRVAASVGSEFEDVLLNSDAEATEGGVRLNVEDAEAWLTDPQTSYPVIIDPSYHIQGGNLYWDTYLNNRYTSDYSLRTYLLIGTYNGGYNKVRTFMTWKVPSWLSSVEITGATLYLWNYHSWSCNSRSWDVFVSETITSYRTWSNQPKALKPYIYPGTAYVYSRQSGTRGYSSSCSDGWVSSNVKNHVQYWVDQGVSKGGLMIRSKSETDSYGWKRFNSSNASSKKPYITVTYNRKPDTPTNLQIDGVTPVAGESVTFEYTDLIPEFSATVSDPDGGTVSALFTIREDGVIIHDKVEGSEVDSGQVSSWELPHELRYGSVYTVEVHASDGSLTSENSVLSATGGSDPNGWTFTAVLPGTSSGGPGSLAPDVDEIPTSCDTTALVVPSLSPSPSPSVLECGGN